MSDPVLSEYDLVALLDDRGRFVYVSPSHEAILGYAPEELIGTVGMELVHPDDVPTAADQVARQQGGEGARVVRVRAKSGAWVRLEGTVYPIGGDSALARHSIMTLRHLEAREAARLARVAEQARERALSVQLEAVLRNAPIGLGLVDREHRFVFVNEELAAMNGVPAEGHTGRTLHEVVPELASVLVPLCDQVLDSGDSIRGIEIEGEAAAKAGERRSWEASYHPVPGGDGIPEGVIAVVQETTSVRREELERGRLQQLVEASSDYVILTAPRANVVYLNAAARRFAGLAPADDVSERSMFDLIDPEQRSRLEREILPALEANRVWSGTFPIRNAETGETVELDWSAFEVEDAEYGALLGGVGRDQRARRAAEAEALESSQALETLFTLSPVPIFTMDLERTIVRVNPAMEAVFGWPADQLIGRTPPLADPPAEVVAARRALHDGQVVSQRATVPRRDGSTIRVVAYASPQFDASGAQIGSIGFLFDIEELEQARERAVHVSRQQEAVAELGLFALGEAAIQMVFDEAVRLVADRLGVELAKILELLPDGEELVLRSGVGWKDGLVGVATVGAGPDSQAGHTTASDAPVVVTDLARETRFTGSRLLQGARGRERAQHGDSGRGARLGRSRGAHRVGESLRRSRRQLHPLDRQRPRRDDPARPRDLRSARAHGRARTARRGPNARGGDRPRGGAEREHGQDRVPLADQPRAADAAERDRRLRAAAGDGRDRPRTERVGRPDPRRGPAPRRPDRRAARGLPDRGGRGRARAAGDRRPELVHEVVALVSPLAREKGVGIEAPAVAGIAALADERRLRQVLLNLLSNAIKYNREGGSVEVAIAEGGGRVTITVSDTGLGIDEKDVERIFEPFQRVPGAFRIEGTGLGLPVTRSLVEAMGGTIRVESAVGAGSVFTLELPAAPR